MRFSDTGRMKPRKSIYHRHRFPQDIIRTQYCCTIVSASVIGMSKIYWPNVESTCRTKRCGAGAFDSARSTRIGYVNDRVQAAISGLAMKSLYGSTDSNITYFGALIRTGSLGYPGPETAEQGSRGPVLR